MVEDKPKDVNQKYLTAKIEYMDNVGNMTVEFSELMNTNLTYINSTYIDIFINPVDLTEYKENEKVQPNHLNLTWNATKFENYTLSIHLDFNDSLQISKNLRYDNITFHVINFTDVFKSLNGLYLDHESKNLTKPIPRQMI